MRMTMRSVQMLAIAFIAMTMMMLSPAYGQESSRQPVAVAEGNGARALEGSWNVQVTFRNCTTGQLGTPIAAMNTFMQGGTMQEFSVGNAPLPRGPGHGIWSHIAGEDFRYSLRFFRFDAAGAYAGYVVTQRQVVMGEDGNSYTATADIQLFNTAGFQFATACANETATRFQ
jgi:hypothetical protein